MVGYHRRGSRQRAAECLRALKEKFCGDCTATDPGTGQDTFRSRPGDPPSGARTRILRRTRIQNPRLSRAAATKKRLWDGSSPANRRVRWNRAVELPADSYGDETRS